MRISHGTDVSFRKSLFPQIGLPQICNHESLADVAIGTGLLRSFIFLDTNVEQRRLFCSMFTQFGHLIHAAFHGLLLPSLAPALCLIPLSLLPCVFFLALCKC